MGFLLIIDLLVSDNGFPKFSYPTSVGKHLFSVQRAKLNEQFIITHEHLFNSEQVKSSRSETIQHAFAKDHK